MATYRTQIEEELNKIAGHLKVIAANTMESYTEYDKIQKAVQSGLAREYFNIGDQLIIPYNNGTSDFQLPFDVVAFHDVELRDGSIVPGMWLQSHYLMQPLQFDAREAFKYAETELPAGTYHFTVPTAWSKLLAGTYQFTLGSAVPAGGQIVFNQNIADVNPSALTVSTFSGPTSTTPIETVAVTEGSGGTDLGQLVAAGNNDLWSMQCAGYGYNRYAQSAMRQFLNSDAAAGAWWTPQSNYDRPPAELTSLRGFMAGFQEDFLKILKPVKVQTARNTVTDGGGTDTTYDTFFPTSLEQEYISPQVSGVEGTYFPYWKERLNLSSPQPTGSGGANAAHIRYAYDNHTSAQLCRLRSAYRGNAYYTWSVYTSGAATIFSAINALRCAPACVIC